MSQKYIKMAGSSRSRGLSLISPGATEEYGSHEFIHNFNMTYSPRTGPYPPFFKGTLKDAMMTGWSRPATKLKLLVIYLHRETNPLTSGFVRIFQSGRVHNLLTNNCTLWGWDITLEENERTLMKIVTDNLGYDNAWRLQHCGKNMFPCFIFLSRTDKKSGVALVQFQRATAELAFAVAIFTNAVQIFMTKIRPQLILKEGRDADVRASLDRATNPPENVGIVSKKGPRNLPKGRPPRADSSVDDFVDNGESIQSLADKIAGRAADMPALFNPEPSGSWNRGTAESPKPPPNYPHRESDEAAKTRLADLKKQYLEAEYQRLKAEKKAIFTRILQEDLAARNQPAMPKSDQSPTVEGVDWELRKKLRNSDNPKNEHKKIHAPTKHAFRPVSPEDRRETITIRFRSHRELFEKNFKADDPFEKLLIYLSGRGYSFTEFKILAGWPRVDISGEDSRTPLRNLNFHFKDNVILAKRKTPHPYVKMK